MRLYRYKRTKNAVLGILKDDVGGTYHTLENASTLIPASFYEVKVCYSPRFEKVLPILVSPAVPASRGVRIHAGNKWNDSQGCVLVGNSCFLNTCVLGDSLNALNQLLKNVGKTLTIEELFR